MTNRFEAINKQLAAMIAKLDIIGDIVEGPRPSDAKDTVKLPRTNSLIEQLNDIENNVQYISSGIARLEQLFLSNTLSQAEGIYDVNT